MAFSGRANITNHRSVLGGPAEGTVGIAFNRTGVRNAFRPHTVDELYRVWTTPVCRPT